MVCSTFLCTISAHRSIPKPPVCRGDKVSPADSEKKKGSRLLKPLKVHEETSPYFLLGAQDQQLGVEQDQLPCGPTETSSGTCQETETCMIWACHLPRQPLQNHPSGHLEGWATPWSAEKLLGGQYQRVDIPAHSGTANKGLLQKTLEENPC